MIRRRLPFTILLVTLLLAAPLGAAPLLVPQEVEDEAVQEETQSEPALTKEERKKRRKERQERKASAETETEAETEGEGDEGGEGGSSGRSEGATDTERTEDEGAGEEADDQLDPDSDAKSDAGSDSASETDSERDPSLDSDSDSSSDTDSDSDSDHPAQVVIATDSACRVYVDGVSQGVLEPGETLEVGVDLGDVEIRASAMEMTRAFWDKTLELEEEGQVETVRVRMKKAIRLQRQTERQSGVFRDRKTSLMWLKRDNGRDVDLRAAYSFCRDLDVGGYDGWRLPTLEELRSIESVWLRASYKIQGEILLTECCMWSTDYDGSERAWTFNYRFRKAFETNAGYQLGLRALCVRDWDPELEGDGEDEKEADEAEDAAADGADTSGELPEEDGDGA